MPELTLDERGDVRIKFIWSQSIKLSNLHPCLVKYEGIAYSSVEHAFQSAKRAHFFPELPVDLDQSCISLKKANNKKNLIDAMRADKKMTIKDAHAKYMSLLESWKQKTLRIMEELLLSKFTLNEDLRLLLLSTGDRNVYEAKFRGGSVWERQDETNFGLLGQLLMNIRKKVK